MNIRTISFAVLVAGIGFYGCGQISETSSLTGTEIGDLSQDSDLAAVSVDLNETTAILGLEGSHGGGQSLNRRRGKRHASPLRGLDLTDEQKAALKELMVASHDEAKAAFEAAKADGADRTVIQDVRKALKADHEAALAGILTPDQLAALQEARDAAADRRSSHTSFAGLDLTEDQQGAVDALKIANREAAKAAIEAAKADGADREAIRAVLEGLRTEFESGLTAILTAEQFADYQAAKAQRETRSRGHRGGRRGHGDTPPEPAIETTSSDVN